MNILKNIFGNKKQPTLKQDLIKAKNWISLALQSSGYKADFSLESLKEIDRFFDEQNKAGGLLSQNRGQRLFVIGAYIGEVIILTVGGEWITDDNDPQGEINVSSQIEYSQSTSLLAHNLIAASMRLKKYFSGRLLCLHAKI